jgi:hypothetical protein
LFINSEEGQGLQRAVVPVMMMMMLMMMVVVVVVVVMMMMMMIEPLECSVQYLSVVLLLLKFI